MKWTVPRKLRVSARYLAAPSSIVVWPSWAAGVHHALVPGTVREGVFFDDRQGVHIRPQADRAGFVAHAQHAHYAGATNAGMHIDAELAQPFGYEIRSAAFFKAQFRVGVQIAPASRRVRRVVRRC